MAELVIHRLKKGFVHVISELELRAFLDQFPGHFQHVRFGAASMSEESGMKWAKAKSWSGTHVGLVTGQRIDERWLFDLVICSLKARTVGEERDAISALMLGDLERWIRSKLTAGPDEPAERHKLFLEFRHDRGTGALASNSFTPAGYR
jgi:hypothetical protein